MRKSIEIGDKIFKTKKEALEYFKNILNSYDFGESLNLKDFNEVYELLKKHPRGKEKIGVGIKIIRIGKVQYKTKCFEFIRNDDSSGYFGYIKCLTGDRNLFTEFSRVCRKVIQDDLRIVKTNYFKASSKRGKVKCQETGELLSYDELTVDHRQPNTFSVIVDRFIENYKIDLSKIRYITVDKYSQEFADKKLARDFRQYHKEKANLRLIKKELNLGRSYQGRINSQKRDLRIE